MSASLKANDGPKPCPKEVLDLVERFDRNREAYQSGQYNEMQLRQEFLDPLFAALGWDMNNSQGYAEAYKDVIHEDSIKVGADTKAPDYCFRIGGTRKFFLEAKKPSIYIKEDISPAFQLRRYAWSAKLPLSILTDFEEFAIYDTRIKPEKTDKASTARITYFTYKDYAEKWGELASVFSREAVLKGSFDKYAEKSRLKKGTATVDDAFLTEIEDWRDMLAKNIALRNAALSTRELNFAVQRTIDRIVFLRICEDRGIEEYGKLQIQLSGTNVYKRLVQLFSQADDRYNSGLFHFQKEKDRHEEPDKLTPNIAIDDKPLKDILKRLYYPESPYEFSVLSADILGQVYEQFLGKVIRLTEGHQAKIEDKPEVRKAGGVYYTPKYIVDYIVKNTVGKLIEGKKPKEIEKVKILDPACGSGSFLLGVYQYLLDWHLKWYINDGPEKWAKGKQPAIFQVPSPGPHFPNWHLTPTEKKRILLNNIYGVDIDSQAVEVTKLSLLLKVLEGENNQTLEKQYTFLHQRALPDLGDNIKCGNSIIGHDYEKQQLIKLDKEEIIRVNAFDWENEFPQIMEAGGFDAVIGNPPYGAYLYEQDKEYLTTHYPLQTYQLDSYLIFLERAVRDLLCQNGYYGMIIPNPWLTNILQRSMRKFVVENTRICHIVHFKFPVFRKVIVDTEVVILQKQNSKNWKAQVTVVDTLQAFLTSPSSSGIKHITHLQKKWFALNGGIINIFTSEEEEAIAAKCASKGASLDALCMINVGIKPYQVGKGTPPQTQKTVEDRPFDSDRRLNASYRPYLRGIDIGRYKISPVEPRYLRYGPWLAEPRPAADFDAPMKILMRQTGDSLIAALDTQQYLCLNNMHVLVLKSENYSVQYLLGIINSTLLNWYYHTLNPEVGEALAEVKKTNVAKLPIRKVFFTDSKDKAHHDKLVTLVEQMLSLNKQLADVKTDQEKTALQRQINAVDKQIDRLVYELYGLTEEEMRIVEDSL